MIIIRPTDAETTGLEPTDEVIELGAYDIRDGHLYTTGYHTLVKPAAPIPAKASAIHHITDADVADAPPWNIAWRKLVEIEPEFDGAELVFAAHMASYERQYLDKLMKVRWICTWKCAHRQWPDLDGHKLQELRYHLNLPISDPALAMPPHRALPDAYLCGVLVLELLKHQSIETLIAWSDEPAVFTKFDFGEHDGKLLSDVPTSYFEWMLRKDFSEDWRWNTLREIDRRKKAYRQAYVERSLVAIAGAACIRDLGNWYLNQADEMAKHGITVDDAEYAAIVGACATRKKQLQEAGEPQFEPAGTTA